MPKYQFLKLEQTQGDEYRWLDMAEDTFLSQKEQLLRRGFEVIGDTIYANNEQEAIANFNAGMSYPIEEYNKSFPIGGLFYAAKGLVEAIQDRFSNNTPPQTIALNQNNQTASKLALFRLRVDAMRCSSAQGLLIPFISSRRSRCRYMGRLLCLLFAAKRKVSPHRGLRL